MEAKQLRIGNLVNIKGHADEIGISAFGIDNFYKGKLEVTPIPLTEEWLFKLGFSDKEYKPGYIGIDFSNQDFVLTKPKVMGDWHEGYNWEFKCTWPKFKELKYVHELQNLYFALTDQELTLKP